VSPSVHDNAKYVSVNDEHSVWKMLHVYFVYLVFLVCLVRFTVGDFSICRCALYHCVVLSVADSLCCPSFQTGLTVVVMAA